ncbi:hypothetical protein [Borreliella bavariensis]|nr:hypothetical protein [Borreliella bavariensis]
MLIYILHIFIDPFLDAMGYCHTDPSCVQVEVSIIVTRKNEIKAVRS